jgi:hypothetical protein
LENEYENVKERIYRIWEAILPGENYDNDTDRSIFEILDQIHGVMMHLLTENSRLENENVKQAQDEVVSEQPSQSPKAQLPQGISKEQQVEMLQEKLKDLQKQGHSTTRPEFVTPR